MASDSAVREETPPILRPDIHPTAIVDPAAQLGPGVRIGPYAVVGAGASFAAGVSVGAGSLIGADPLQSPSWTQLDAVKLEEGVAVGAHCRITGNVAIGANTEIFDGCRLRGALTLGAECKLFDGVILAARVNFPGVTGAKDGSRSATDAFCAKASLSPSRCCRRSPK